MKSFFPGFLALASSLTLAHAHHGQEFFLLYDARVQQPRHGVLQQNFSFIDEGDDDSLSLSPSLSLGVLPRTAFNLRADFADDANQGWTYRSIEPGFQIDLTPPNLKLPIRIGFAASYQFGEGGESTHTHGAADLSGETVAHVHDNNSTNSTAAATHVHAAGAAHDDTGTGTAAHDHSTHDHPPLVETPPGEDAGPDGLTAEEIAAINAANAAAAAAADAQAAAAAAQAASQAQAQAANTAPAAKPKPKSKSTKKAPAPAAHSHSADEAESGHSHSGSIHNHDDNLFTARLIFEADLTENTLLVANLINVIPEGGDVAWGYAIGVRQRLRPGLSVGVEALGDFDRNKHQEVLGAVFWEPMHHVLLKVGVGTGLTAISPDTTVRAGVLWMF
ncbi:MAG: hypothetical protein JWL81_485 [Verrucomicrobiales bacterium]|nr:hypothetical protein [Verrucomicrobiales bacterium]